MHTRDKSMDLGRLLLSQSQDLCFWRSVIYQVCEKQSATVLGPLGPAFMPKMCPHSTLSYNLTNGKYNFTCNASLNDVTEQINY
jgi:hypothetical protein